MIDYARDEGFHRIVLSTGTPILHSTPNACVLAWIDAGDDHAVGKYMCAANALYSSCGFVKTKESVDLVGVRIVHYEYNLTSPEALTQS